MHLSPRQRDIAERIIRGQKFEAIAIELKISVRTVRFHVENIRRRAHKPTTLQAVLFFLNETVYKDSCPNSQLMLF